MSEYIVPTAYLWFPYDSNPTWKITMKIKKINSLLSTSPLVDLLSYTVTSSMVSRYRQTLPKGILALLYQPIINGTLAYKINVRDVTQNILMLYCCISQALPLFISCLLPAPILFDPLASCSLGGRHKASWIGSEKSYQVYRQWYIFGLQGPTNSPAPLTADDGVWNFRYSLFG